MDTAMFNNNINNWIEWILRSQPGHIAEMSNRTLPNVSGDLKCVRNTAVNLENSRSAALKNDTIVSGSRSISCRLHRP